MPVLIDPTGSTVMNTLNLPANRDADFVLAPEGVIFLRQEGGGAGTSIELEHQLAACG